MESSVAAILRAELQSCGVTQRDTLLVGVSGGVDSVVLLHALLSLKGQDAFCAIHVAHLNHGIRDCAAQDASFVHALCEAWGVQVTIAQEDVPARANAWGMTMEEAARMARYSFLRRVKAQTSAAYILTAHHMDDQAETVLLHILRGSGLRGLCGMQPRNGDLIRPLLHVRRQEIEAYAQAHRLTHCEDQTNTDLAYTRNRIRHALLPLLSSEYNPAIVQGLCQMADLLREDEAYLTSVAKAALQENRLPERDGGIYAYRRAGLAALKMPIQTRAIRLALEYAGALYNQQQGGILSICKLLGARTGAYRALPNGMRVWVEYDALCVGKPRDPCLEAFETPFMQGGETLTPDGVFRAERAAAWHKESSFVAYIDAAMLPENTVARRRRPGDRFHPLHAPGARKLKEYLIDKKVPREARGRPLLAAGAEVLFVPGGTIAHRLRVTEDTTYILRIIYEDCKEQNKKEGDSGDGGNAV